MKYIIKNKVKNKFSKLEGIEFDSLSEALNEISLIDSSFSPLEYHLQNFGIEFSEEEWKDETRIYDIEYEGFRLAELNGCDYGNFVIEVWK